jgi:hypothetical protein
MPQRSELELFLVKVEDQLIISMRSGLKLNYSMYDVEFYVVVLAMKHWSSYLAYNKLSCIQIMKH